MPKLFSPLAAGQIKAPAAILDGILAHPMGRGAGSWPFFNRANLD